jgi:hypothetical protein
MTRSTSHEKTYHVPRQFGMAGIMALTTLMAFLFGILRAIHASQFWFLFWIVLFSAVCLVQLRFPQRVRMASVLMGILIFTLLATVRFFADGSFVGNGVFVFQVTSHSATLENLAFFMYHFGLPMCLLGGMFGYLCGYLVAFCFLLLDKFSSQHDTKVSTDSGIQWLEKTALHLPAEKPHDE